MTFKNVECIKCKKEIIIYLEAYKKSEIEKIICYDCYVNEEKK